MFTALNPGLYLVLRDQNQCQRDPLFPRLLTKQINRVTLYLIWKDPNVLKIYEVKLRF